MFTTLFSHLNARFVTSFPLIITALHLPYTVVYWGIEAYAELGITMEKDLVITEDRSLYPQRFYRNVTSYMNTALQQAMADTGIPTTIENTGEKGNCTDFDTSMEGKRRKEEIGIQSIKTYDYCFIGAYRIDADTRRNRQWIIPFIKEYFTNQSFLQFTDDKTKSINQITGQSSYQPMGPYDQTLNRKGFVPKYIKEKIKARNYFDAEYFETMSKCRYCLAPAGDRFYSMRFLEALMTKCIPIVRSKQEVFRSRREANINYYYYLTKEVRKKRGHLQYRESWVDINFDTFLRRHTLEYFPHVDDDIYDVNNDKDSSDEDDDDPRCCHSTDATDIDDNKRICSEYRWKKGHKSLVKIWDD